MRLMVSARSWRASLEASGASPGASSSAPEPAGRPPGRQADVPYSSVRPICDRQAASTAPPTDRHPPGRPAATPTAGRTPEPRPSCRSLRAALQPRSGFGRCRPWPRRRPPAEPPCCAPPSTARCTARASSLRPTLPVRSASSKLDCAGARREAMSVSLPSRAASLASST